MSDRPLGEGWWVASDGKWYAPELHPARQRAAPPPPAPASPPPAPVAVGKRRGRGFLVASVLVGSLGALVFVAGVVAGTIDDLVPVLDADADAITPQPVEFTAQARSYKVTAEQLGDADDPISVSSLTCVVTKADGSTVELQGRADAPKFEFEGRDVASIGSFDAVAGATTIACEGVATPLRIVVGEALPVRELARVILITGIVICAVAVALLVVGILRWRRSST